MVAAILAGNPFGISPPMGPANGNLVPNDPARLPGKRGNPGVNFKQTAGSEPPSQLHLILRNLAKPYTGALYGVRPSMHRAGDEAGCLDRFGAACTFLR
jgi:hypothetical protein